MTLVSKIAAALIGTILVVAVFLSSNDDMKKPIVSEQVSISDNDSPSEAVVAVASQIKAIEDNHQKLTRQNAGLQMKIDELSKKIIALDATMRTNTNTKTDIEQENALSDETDLGKKFFAEKFVLGHRGQSSDDYRWIVPQVPFVPTPRNVTTIPPLPVSPVRSTRRQQLIIPTGSLIQGRTLTGVIGRIPIGGRVAEPWPFKIIAIRQAYAPNHHTFDVAGMIFEGIAQGDFSFKCARGRIIRATTVLSDRSIISASGKNADSIGWISDSASNPCLPGRLITNAGNVLAKKLLLDTTAAAARAAADAERTNTVSADGIERSVISGDEFRVTGAEAIAAGAQSVRDYYNKRGDIWDAIHVAAGQEIIIHITEELQFHYINDKKLYDQNHILRASHQHDSVLD